MSAEAKIISDAAIVRAVVDEFGEGCIESLIRLTGVSRESAIAALERGARAGLIEYGVSIDLALPAPKGWELLANWLHVEEGPNDEPLDVSTS